MVYNKYGRPIRSTYITSTKGEGSELFAQFRKALKNTGHFHSIVGGASWSFFQMSYFENAPGGIRRSCDINLTFDEDTNTVESYSGPNNDLIYTQVLTGDMDHDVQEFITNQPQIQKVHQEVENITTGNFDWQDMDMYVINDVIRENPDFALSFIYRFKKELGWEVFIELFKEEYLSWFTKGGK